MSHLLSQMQFSDEYHDRNPCNCRERVHFIAPITRQSFAYASSIERKHYKQNIMLHADTDE